MRVWGASMTGDEDVRDLLFLEHKLTNQPQNLSVLYNGI